MTSHAHNFSPGVFFALAVTALMVGSSPADIAAQAIDPGGEGIDLAAMTEDVEIMGRILTKAVAVHYAGISGTTVQFPQPSPKKRAGSASGKALVTTLGLYNRVLADRVSTPDLNMRGFYVPGSGVFFVFDVRARTVLMAKTEKEEAKGDLWEKTEEEVRKGETYVFVDSDKSQQRTAIDPEAVDTTVDLLLAAVARHGRHIEQLVPGDSITLAVRIRPHRGVTWGPDSALFAEPAYFVVSNVWIGDVAPQQVIIQVPVAAIEDHPAGEIDLEALKEQTRITRY